jgi:two-component system OmpR family sensor kinase
MRRPEFPRHVSLRVRLLTGLITLLTLGLTLTGVVSALLLRSYLFSRTDQRLAQAQELVDTRLVALLPRTAPDLGTALLSRAVAPTDYILEIKPPTGPTMVVTGRSGDRAGSAPLSDGVRDLTARAAAGNPFTIRAGQARYRAVAGRLPADGGTDLVALPLHPVEATIGRLVAIGSITGVAVLALAVGSAWFMLGRGLRPLRDVAETASAIAAGDLSRRVPRSPAGGEMARLAAALNVMLGQIQAAFDDRVRSRERLRLFVADASHELRTPLTSVRGYVDLLRKDMVPPGGVDDALRRVHEETARMSTL